jgi:hypothetical protein
MNQRVTTEEQDAQRGDRGVMFWTCAFIATLLYVLFTYMLMMVPGFEPVEKLSMLAITMAAAATALIIGCWKPATTEAPIATSRVAAVAGRRSSSAATAFRARGNAGDPSSALKILGSSCPLR